MVAVSDLAPLRVALPTVVPRDPIAADFVMPLVFMQA